MRLRMPLVWHVVVQEEANAHGKWWLPILGHASGVKVPADRSLPMLLWHFCAYWCIWVYALSGEKWHTILVDVQRARQKSAQSSAPSPRRVGLMLH